MNILLLGSGGRESALAWKISQSLLCSQLFIAPGNGGTKAYGTNVALDAMDFDAVKKWVADNDIDMIVVGNEDPLVKGIRDFMKGTDVLIVGPGADGARLEGSKDFAKQFMGRHAIPTAAYRSFTAETIEDGYSFLETLRPPYVLKADGLAAGKGVLIIPDIREAKASLKDMLDGRFGNASSTVVIEEFLDGIECSVFVLTDGTGAYVVLPVAKDYKRVGEGDTGPNTGGMGAVSPVVFADEAFMDKVTRRIIEPTLAGLRSEGIDYRGFIFLGLINVGGDPYVIEYNVRMGDPETEAVMPRIESDLVELMQRAATGTLANAGIDISPLTSTTVIAVAKGYPGSYAKGDAISFPSKLQPAVEVFHAGTKETEAGVVTSGGRVLAVSAQDEDIESALTKCYETLEGIRFEGMNFRRDIGQDLIKLSQH